MKTSLIANDSRFVDFLSQKACFMNTIKFYYQLSIVEYHNRSSLHSMDYYVFSWILQ